MSSLVPYSTLLLYPVLVIFPFNVVGFLWGFQHGSEPMPRQLALRSNRIDNLYGLWIRDALLLLMVLSFAIYHSVSFSQLGLHLKDWQWNFLIGIGASFFQLGLQAIALKLTRSKRRVLEDPRLLEGSAVQWTFSNIVSVLAQEIWIAFCYVTLRQTGHSAVTSVLLVGSIFGVAHFQYKLGALATAFYGVAFTSLFLWRNSLIPSLVIHYLGNISSLFLARRSVVLLKGSDETGQIGKEV
jgi:hypothetical protein